MSLYSCLKMPKNVSKYIKNPIYIYIYKYSTTFFIIVTICESVQHLPSLLPVLIAVHFSHLCIPEVPERLNILNSGKKDIMVKF